MGEYRSRRFSLLASAGLAALVLLQYAGVARLGFLHYDDNLYVTENATVLRGLTGDGVAWALSALEVSAWQPLAWLSHMLDVQLFGLDAGAHHLVSAALHALNAVLLFLALARLTGAPRRSALAAALFAVHPLHVEPVAWVSERKELLAACFGLLALRAWAAYVERPSVRRYAGVAALFACSLASKAMWVTFPALLLVLDAWPLRRRLSARLVLEKLPLLALSAAASAVAVLAQERSGALLPLERLGLADRLGGAVVGQARYLGKIFWPWPLSAYYPLPRGGPTGGAIALAALVLGIVTASCVLKRRKAPWLAAGWAWFLGTLVPVIGLVQVGSQSIADRYTYLPAIGLFLAVAWQLAAWAEARPALARPIAAATGLALVALAAVTLRQVPVWRDQVTLFEEALAVTEENPRAHHLLSQALEVEGQLGPALVNAGEAARLDPANARVQKNLGYMLYKAGRYADAVAALERAVALDPAYAEAHGNLALAYGRVGRMELAAREMGLERRLRSSSAQP